MQGPSARVRQKLFYSWGFITKASELRIVRSFVRRFHAAEISISLTKAVGAGIGSPTCFIALR